MELIINSYKEMKIKSIIENFFDDIYDQLNKADLLYQDVVHQLLQK